MVLGLTSRTLLDRLKLLLVPRLSIILTLVVMCLVFAVSVLDYFEYTPSAQAVLLPMVILTMTVERFYVTTEEDNAWFALHLLASTLGMAFCVYLVLRWDTVGGRPPGLSRVALLHGGRAGLVGTLHRLSLDRAVALPRPAALQAVRKRLM